MVVQRNHALRFISARARRAHPPVGVSPPLQQDCHSSTSVSRSQPAWCILRRLRSLFCISGCGLNESRPRGTYQTRKPTPHLHYFGSERYTILHASTWSGLRWWDAASPTILQPLYPPGCALPLHPFPPRLQHEQPSRVLLIAPQTCHINCNPTLACHVCRRRRCCCCGNMAIDAGGIA
jgi:hypothetical protein